MKREIKFRGRQKDDSWVYGGILQWNGFSAIIKHKIMVDGIWQTEKIMVVPESVGQFTGLKDKNGKEIYEGDKFADPLNEKIVGVVKCGDKDVFSDKVEKHGGHIGFFVEFNNSFTRRDLKYWSQYEIIGNIYENNK